MTARKIGKPRLHCGGGKRRGWSVLALLMLCISAGAGANDDETETFVSLQMENDFFASTGDRYYTHGTQLSLLKEAAPPSWLATLAGWMPLYHAGDKNLVNYTLGQKIFTPDNTKSTEMMPGDRPYAGYLYVGASVISALSNGDGIDYGNLFEITFGIVGQSALSEQTQKGFHDLIGIESPKGWDNQLHDEPALGVTYSRFWRIVHPAAGSLEYSVSPQATLALGNVYTYVAGGVMFRIGDNLRRDLSPPNIRPGFPGLSYFHSGNEPSWYFFLGWESRLVARDIFLDGNTFEDSYSVEKERLVGDMQFGLVYLFDRWRLGMSNMLRTDEFKTQRQPTRYGSLNISRRF